MFCHVGETGTSCNTGKLQQVYYIQNSFKNITFYISGSVEKVKNPVICYTYGSLYVKGLCAHDLPYGVLVWKF